MVYPSYYKKFKCIGGACRHNCCIGWEIDIDENTYSYYKSVGGEMGARLDGAIAHGEAPHFILGDGERCPFLNRDNLCDIIINLGMEHICDICTEHPRFKNELPDRVEVGLGLACEEAARIILSEKEAAVLVGAAETDDEIILLRDELIAILQNRALSLDKRIREMLVRANAAFCDRSLAEWKEVFMSLERLDKKWGEYLSLLDGKLDFNGFARHMRGREHEYEQLAVYFIYRYFANSPDFYEASLRAAFAALCVKIIYALGGAMFTKNGDFTFADQVELCRMFSSEIEYSDENVYALLDEMN